jgi:SAM-dependent methyltransferase
MIKTIARNIGRYLSKTPLKGLIVFGIKCVNTPRFISDFVNFNKLSKNSNAFFSSARLIDSQLCLTDKTIKTGFDPHYIYHTSWAARVLAETRPKLHVDISSSLYFNSIVSAFVPISFYDYRPAEIKLSNLKCNRANLTALEFEGNSISSLSCMHVIEHIGLGRYGDQLDPEGDRKAFKELKRVLAPKGDLLIVVPVGKARIKFNAHRIYSYEMIRTVFSELQLKQFALITNAIPAQIILNASKEIVHEQYYGCGCFWFKKS